MREKTQKNKPEAASGERSKSNPVPAWMDCVWRRTSCGKNSCPICGTPNTGIGNDTPFEELWKSLENEEHITKNALARISRKMREFGFAFERIGANRERLPQPSEFSFYRKVRGWQRSVLNIISEAQDLGYLWPYSENTADFFWYANILLAKIYRQLISRKWIREHDLKYDPEYHYTRYVLRECIGEIKKSLNALSCLHSEQKAELMLSLSQITKLEKDILTL